jgi:hypothetical protein
MTVLKINLKRSGRAEPGVTLSQRPPRRSALRPGKARAIADEVIRCRDAHATSGMGQSAPSNFATATAELASIADAGAAWRGPRRSATSPRRQVLPNDRTAPLTGAAPAPGQLRTYALHKRSGKIFTYHHENLRRGRSRMAPRQVSTRIRWALRRTNDTLKYG